jgi:hypothetical protein
MVDDPSERGDDEAAKAQERRRLVWRLAVVAAGVLVLLVLVVVLPPRFTAHSTFDKDHEELKAQNDVRTTLLQGLGALLVLTGAAIGASVAYRGVQETRRQIAQTAADNQEQFTLTRQGQITDRYTKAVEQLGHEKAPVRLGALYSLDHLAQDNPEYRQTVVDVVCAYLRMPFPPLAQTDPDAEQVEKTARPANGRDRPTHLAPGRDPAREELQVRQTAQRLLAEHLRCPPKTSSQKAQLLQPLPQQTFWPGISLELTGATLIYFNLAEVSIIRARFEGATFEGDAWFREATFEGDAWFGEATFQGNAKFDKATFQGDAGFGRAKFQGAWFGGATFQGAWFDGAKFQGAGFGEATFQGEAGFDKATFQGDAKFDKATFRATSGSTRRTCCTQIIATDFVYGRTDGPSSPTRPIPAAARWSRGSPPTTWRMRSCSPRSCARPIDRTWCLSIDGLNGVVGHRAGSRDADRPGRPGVRRRRYLEPRSATVLQAVLLRCGHCPRRTSIAPGSLGHRVGRGEDACHDGEQRESARGSR